MPDLAYLLYGVEYDDYNFYAIFSTQKQLKEYINRHTGDNRWTYCRIAKLPLNPTDDVDIAEFNGLIHREELEGG